MGETLRILVTEPIMARFRDTLTRDGTSPHEWVFAYGDTALGPADASDVLVGSALPPALLAAAPRLRLVHATGAGVDRIAVDHLPPAATLANTFHHGRSIAEHVVAVSRTSPGTSRRPSAAGPRTQPTRCRPLPRDARSAT